MVRQADPGAVPYSVFLPGALGKWMYDRKGVIKPSASYRGDFLKYNDRVEDLRNAKAAGAAGVLFVKPLPRRQIIDHYEPYEGTRWGVPAMFLGADEGKRLSDAVAAGGAPRATITPAHARDADHDPDAAGHAARAQQAEDRGGQPHRRHLRRGGQRPGGAAGHGPPPGAPAPALPRPDGAVLVQHRPLLPAPDQPEAPSRRRG